MMTIKGLAMKDKTFPWINSEINLFDVTLGIPLWLENVSVSEIQWLKGNPRQNGVIATVTLWERLSDSSFLLKLSEDDRLTFDLARQEYGPRDNYDLSLVVARFAGCEILNKRIDDLVIVNPQLQAAVGVFVQMRVLFKMFEGKGVRDDR